MNKIRIQSKITITVTSGLQYDNLTNPDAHVPDRLKVSPKWMKHTIQIKEGVGEYPEEIVDWPTVKSLVKDKIITVQGVIPEETPVRHAIPTDVEEVEETPKTTRRGKKTLEEVVGEE